MSKLKSRFDFRHVLRRLSTLLSALTTAQAGAAAAFIAAPQEWRNALPEWLGLALLAGSMATGALVPLATSYKQKGMGQP